MNRHNKTTRRLPALALAAMMTLAMLAGINGLAVDAPASAAATLAAKAVPASAPRA